MNSSPAPLREAPTALFGWQGIEVTVPARWELGAYGGDHSTGYACLDDGTQMRLRVRWSAKGMGNAEALRNRYARSLRKKLKNRHTFEPLEPEFLPARFRKDRMVAPFRWEGDQVAYGVAWHCTGCGRSVVLEALSPPERAERKSAKRILSSALDHREDGQRQWSVYGFAFQTPAPYNLEKADLRSGRLRFRFTLAKTGWLHVERWSLASEAFRRIPFVAWPRELLKSLPLRGFRIIDQSETAVRAHAGQRFMAKGPPPGWFSRLRPPQEASGVVWHCPEGDKVYAAAGGGEGMNALDDLVATVECD